MNWGDTMQPVTNTATHIVLVHGHLVKTCKSDTTSLSSGDEDTLHVTDPHKDLAGRGGLA